MKQKLNGTKQSINKGWHVTLVFRSCLSQVNTEKPGIHVSTAIAKKDTHPYYISTVEMGSLWQGKTYL